jgi:hypothetical protein
MNKPVRNVGQYRAGVGEHVPTVPALVAAEVHAERNDEQQQRGDAEHLSPAEAFGQQRFHVAQAEEAEHESRPGEGKDEHEVVPFRHAGHGFEVEQVGEDVGRVGEEQQPGRHQPGEREAVVAQTRAQQDIAAQRKRDGGEK